MPHIDAGASGTDIKETLRSWATFCYLQKRFEPPRRTVGGPRKEITAHKRDSADANCGHHNEKRKVADNKRKYLGKSTQQCPNRWGRNRPRYTCQCFRLLQLLVLVWAFVFARRNRKPRNGLRIPLSVLLATLTIYCGASVLSLPPSLKATAASLAACLPNATALP